MSNYEWDKQYSRQRIGRLMMRLFIGWQPWHASHATTTFRILTWIQRLRHGRKSELKMMVLIGRPWSRFNGNRGWANYSLGPGRAPPRDG